MNQRNDINWSSKETEHITAYIISTHKLATKQRILSSPNVWLSNVAHRNYAAFINALQQRKDINMRFASVSISKDWMTVKLPWNAPHLLLSLREIDDSLDKIVLLTTIEHTLLINLKWKRKKQNATPDRIIFDECINASGIHLPPIKKLSELPITGRRSKSG